jgi:hypothetical protein
MKKLLTALLASASLAAIGQVDPGVGNISVTDVNNVNLQSSNLQANSRVVIHLSLQNLNQTNAVNNGKIVLKLGSALSVPKPNNSPTANLNHIFSWTYLSATNSIEGELIDVFPADEYGAETTFELNVGSTGNGTIEAEFTGTGDENPTNNKSTMQYSVVATALPVELLDFTGLKLASNHNKLSWTTANEKDFDFFEIQKANDAKTFEGIGKIKGTTKQTSYLQVYTFDDKDANSPINYYRLKMVDVDGKFKYSNIISLQNELNKSIVGEFYPNPAETFVQIDVVAQSDGEWKLTTTDLAGKVIATKNEYLKKGGNKLHLDTSRWAPGVSLVQFESKNENLSISRKILKQ